MADTNDLDVPDLPPPPAYEFCQAEFDQKVSHAIEESQNQQVEDDEFEVWDEAAFAAAAARLTLTDRGEGSSSSSRSPMNAQAASPASTSPSYTTSGGSSSAGDSTGSAIQPLRIVKKAQVSPTNTEKERPSWYAEAQLDNQSSSASASAAQSSSQSSRLPQRMNSYVERERTPPPMFTSVAESLEGPPYEESQRAGLVLSYIPGDSRPASPLHSPTSPSLHASIPSPSPMSPQSPDRRSLPRPPPHASRSISPPVSPPPITRLQHQSVPPPPRLPAQRLTTRPSSSYNAKPRPYASRLAFDPRVAYGGSEKSSPYSNANREEPPMPSNFDAASLYNSSVASLYSSSALTSSSPYSPAPQASNSSYHTQHTQVQSSSSYSGYQAQDSAPSQGMGGYASSRASLRSPTPSEHRTSSPYSQTYGAQSGYQQYQTSQAAIPQPLSNYQPTTYQQQQQQQTTTSYQPTTYQSQQISYQPTAFQHTSPQQSSFQQSTYQATAYQQSGYRPTSYQPTTY